MAACPLLDDLFSWAAQQPTGNFIAVICNLATNQSTFQGRDKNLVSYAEGTLNYHPGGWIIIEGLNLYLPPTFTGSLTQYFSDRRYTTAPTSFDNYPFDANNTDPLNLSISGSSGSYSVSIQSPKWGFTQGFMPQCEAGVIYGTVDNVELLVISLCNRRSEPPPP